MKNRKLRVSFVLIIGLFMIFISSLDVYADALDVELEKVLDYNALNNYSDTIKFTSENFSIIKGDLVDDLLVSDVISMIKVDDLKADYENVEIKIVRDSSSLVEEEVLESDDIVLNGMRIIFDDNNIYNIIVVGDVVSDGIVNVLDMSKMIDDYLSEGFIVGPLNDVNDDGFFNSLDITYIKNAINTKSWDNNVIVSDSLISEFSINKENIYINDVFVLSYMISGFNMDFINGIEGNLVYDKDYLQYIDYDINKSYGNINKNGKFGFILDAYNNETLNQKFILTIRFKAIKEGNTEIEINNIMASMNGVKLNLDKNSISKKTTIHGYGIGGDVDSEFDSDNKPSYEEKADSPSNGGVNLVVRPTVNDLVMNKAEEKTNNVVATVISLSNDNYIKSLEIKDYNIDFDMKNYEYSLSVPNDVSSLDFTIILNNDNASYKILGNDNFKVGKNIVEIVVTAEDGSEKTYTINVNRKKEEILENDSTSNSSRVVIIILIVLVIIGLIYVIFKDDEEDDDNK